ncbi:MAG: hypothetical protein ABI422_02265 [Sphingomicrobium sp.]
MMVMRWLIGLAATLAAAGATAEQPEQQPAQAFATCEGQRFVFKAGEEPHATRITLCSKKDAGKDDLVRMLESAATKIEALDSLPQERRSALVAQIKAKIIEVQATNYAAKPLPPVAPIPAPITAPTMSLPLATPMPPKPLPVAVPILTRPRLNFQCSTPRDLGVGGPCFSLERDTQLIVRADESLAGGTSLRFLRRGDARGEIALAPMSIGQSRRVKLPSALCAGVSGSRVEIQIVQRGSVVDSLGPYPLRC